jgi:hypothetical protein
MFQTTLNVPHKNTHKNGPNQDHSSGRELGPESLTKKVVQGGVLVKHIEHAAYTGLSYIPPPVSTHPTR